MTKSIRKKIMILLSTLIFIVTLSCNYIYALQKSCSINMEDIPMYDGNPAVIVNNNTPYFRKPKTIRIYKKYSKLDKLGRVGQCEVLCGTEYLPNNHRKSIERICPTGWNPKKYSFIKGKNLYNRCHLIGYQIAGDNADERNLITGTRYLNINGMLPYENKIIQYIKTTKHHVKYRVTPIFIDKDKLARGVLMEAYSIEDNKIQFNVFCYNVQPWIYIDYKTGSSFQTDPIIGIKTFFKNITKGGN